MSDATRLDSSQTTGLEAALAGAILDADLDMLARHLGLADAGSAGVLRAHPASLARLAARLADGCHDLPEGEAIAQVKAMLGVAGAAASSGGQHG